jgi:hypothetical protein
MTGNWLWDVALQEDNSSSLCPFTVVALTLAVKEVPGSPSFPGTLAFPPSAAFGQTLCRASASLNIFLQLLRFISNVPRSKNRNEAHTQSTFVVSLRRFGRKSPDISFATALSATNRHRSAASYRLTTLFCPLFRLHSFSSFFQTPQVGALALGR